MKLQEHGSARPDAKGRITLGKLAEGVSSFRIYRDEREWIILEPYCEIPKKMLMMNYKSNKPKSSKKDSSKLD